MGLTVHVGNLHFSPHLCLHLPVHGAFHEIKQPTQEMGMPGFHGYTVKWQL